MEEARLLTFYNEQFNTPLQSAKPFIDNGAKLITKRSLKPENGFFSPLEPRRDRAQSGCNKIHSQ